MPPQPLLHSITLFFKPMRVALHKGKGLIGGLIRWQTRSQYSHASLVTREGKVYESREGIGVRGLNRMPADQDCDYFEIRGLTEEQERKIVAWCISKLGSRYDYRSVFRFMTRRPEHARDANRWFCSEYVFAAVLYAGGIRLLHRIEPWKVSPALLALSPLLKPKEPECL